MFLCVGCLLGEMTRNRGILHKTEHLAVKNPYEMRREAKKTSSALPATITIAKITQISANYYKQYHVCKRAASLTLTPRQQLLKSYRHERNHLPPCLAACIYALTGTASLGARTYLCCYVYTYLCTSHQQP